MISYLDEQVGDLVAGLKDLGLYDNTLILFTSDNGPTYTGGADTPFFDSAAPFRTTRGWAKGYVHEGGIRVPLIASWPGHIEPGSVTDRLTAFYDYLPTLGEVAGVPVPGPTDGISFLPTLKGRNGPVHDFLYWEFPEYNGQQAVRMGRWKGIRKDIQDGKLDIALYDLETDAREQNDRAPEHPDVVEQIRQIMAREHQPSPIARFKMAALGD
jgi:arylsulfatase